MAMHVKIEKLVYGGDGLGHADGHTVFVPFVLPDEVVAVHPVERKKKFVRGHVEQVLAPSPERAPAPCPHFGACGGCHYQHIPYQAQLRYKTDILRETLRRIGKVEWPGLITTHPSPPFGYRNRAQWKVRPVGGRPAIGYFRGGTSALCAVNECGILAPRLAETLAALRGLLERNELPPMLREVEAFTDAAGGRLLLNAAFERFGAAPARIAETLRGAVASVDSLLLMETSREGMELFGPGWMEYEAAGHRYRVGHLSFFQVNRFLVEEMARAVAEHASGEAALDLYAGVGLFTVPLAKRFARVVAVEADPAAARDLAANLETAGATAKPVNAAAESYLGDCRERPDLVVLDPPRAGVEPAALEALAKLAPPRIAYLSCDPATLARDLAALVAAGYRIEELHLFDVFPQTYHIESLARLARGP